MSQQQGLPHDENRTPAKAAMIEDQLHDMTCHLQRSARYHRARERFFDSWSNTISVLSLVAGSAVVVSILKDNTAQWVPLACGAMVAVLQALEQVNRFGSKARDHNSLAGEFLALERVITMKNQISEQDLRDISAEILTIETREPPIKRYLDLICHNQVARSIGSDDIEKITPLQKTFAQYLNGDTALQR